MTSRPESCSGHGGEDEKRGRAHETSKFIFTQLEKMLDFPESRCYTFFS